MPILINPLEIAGEAAVEVIKHALDELQLKIDGKVGNGEYIRGTKDIPVAVVGRRQADVGPCNVPMYNFDICKSQGNGVTITASSPAPGVAQFDSIPPACMDLMVVMTGSCNGTGPLPEMCGSACMKYTDLSADQLTALQNSLGA